MKKLYSAPKIEVLGDVRTITGMPKLIGFGDPGSGNEDPPLPS